MVRKIRINVGRIRNLGEAILKGSHAGLVKVAGVIRDRLQFLTPPWYGQKVIIQEIAQGDVYVGPTGFVPEEEEEGAKRVKDTCAEFKFKFVNVRVKNKSSRPWLRQMKDEMISSGLAKAIIIDELMDELVGRLG